MAHRSGYSTRAAARATKPHIVTSPQPGADPMPMLPLSIDSRCSPGFGGQTCTPYSDESAHSMHNESSCGGPTGGGRRVPSTERVATRVARCVMRQDAPGEPVCRTLERPDPRHLPERRAASGPRHRTPPRRPRLPRPCTACPVPQGQGAAATTAPIAKSTAYASRAHDASSMPTAARTSSNSCSTTSAPPAGSCRIYVIARCRWCARREA
jgi:hypothetical protein